MYKAIFFIPFEIHIGCGMMQNHWHNVETSVWRFFVYLQHHVKVLPLNVWSELARSALYQVFAYSLYYV